MNPFSNAAGASAFAGGKMLALRTQGVGIVTFNQPEKRNAMSVEMWDGLGLILDDFAADPDVRSAILTGAGFGNHGAHLVAFVGTEVVDDDDIAGS